MHLVDNNCGMIKPNNSWDQKQV